jgi:hypothetical protein
MGTLPSGLALALISALVWLAYTHPRSYRRLYPALAGVALAVEIGAIGYYVGFINGANALRTASAALGPIDPPLELNWLIFGPVAFGAVNTFLVYLHPILGLGKRESGPPGSST